MSIERANFDAVSEQDLQQLVAAQVPEGLRLEYKRETYGNTDAEKREFLKDISAFANSSGGHLILGMEEAGGIATGLVGVGAVDADVEILRLEQVAQNGLEPRIAGARMKVIRLAAGGIAMVIRVPRSWNSPHRVVAQRANRFYMRNSAGVYEPNVEELRALFNESASSLSLARKFRTERLAEIQSGQGPSPLVGGGRIILHLIPVAAFSKSVVVDVRQAYAQEASFQPIGSTGIRQFNYHGFINQRGGNANHGYTQVFRNGILEATKGGIVRTTQNGRRTIAGIGTEEQIFQVLHTYVTGLKDLGVPPPLIFMLTLEGVSGVSYTVQQNIWDDPEPVLPSDIITLPECVIEDYGTRSDHHLAVKPAFDALWNAAGHPGASSFNEQGEWIGRR